MKPEHRVALAVASLVVGVLLIFIGLWWVFPPAALIVAGAAAVAAAIRMP